MIVTTCFVDKDGRFTGQNLVPGGYEVPVRPWDARMIWDANAGAWQETPATLADKDAPPPVDRVAALEAALIAKGVVSQAEIDAKTALAEPVKEPVK